MKSGLSIFLICCLTLPVFVVFSILKTEKSELRRNLKWRMIENLRDGDLHSLSFSIEESKTILDWKHSKEFEFKGVMYDIVRTDMRRDSVTYIVWPDRAETKLTKDLSALFLNAFNGHLPLQNHQVIIVQYFKSLYCQKFLNFLHVDADLNSPDLFYLPSLSKAHVLLSELPPWYEVK